MSSAKLRFSYFFLLFYFLYPYLPRALHLMTFDILRHCLCDILRRPRTKLDLFRLTIVKNESGLPYATHIFF